MASNSGSGFRIGAVKARSQTYNAKAGIFVKRDNGTGKFMAAKKTAYKGVRKK